LQDYQDYFLRHFPEESGETQSACGAIFSWLEATPTGFITQHCIMIK
jgi:hypothetical protein